VTFVDRAGISATATPPFSIAFSTTGQGDVTSYISSPSDPNAEEFLLVSTTQPPILGSGPLFGLSADAFSIFFYPPSLPPLHGFLNSSGLQVISFPPGSLPSGFSFDARAILIVPPLPKASNIVRVTL
jgi:hypothetical protein